MNEALGDYTLNEHLHQYAIWTAARAAGISRFSNREISGFIVAMDLRKDVEHLAANINLDRQQYRDWFTKKTDELLAKMNEGGAGKFRNISFGVAAKVISIYIKTYHILPSRGEGVLSTLAYPPIDSILLGNKQLGKQVAIKKTNWSKFTQSEFFEVLENLETHTNGYPFWKLEAYWSSVK